MTRKERSTKGIKNHRGIKIFSIVLAILIIVASGSYFYIDSKLSKINIKNITDDPNKLSIKEDNFKSPDKSEDNFKNILLMGIDFEIEVNNNVSADSIIIATIDKKHNKLKLTSLTRDSYVNVDGHGYTKLKYGYSYGGPELLIKTINENYDMNIKDYVLINTFNLEKIIDYIGGVSIDIKDEELKYVNGAVSQMSHITSTQYTPISKPGLQKLTGRQAVAYSRIRDIGNGDIERTERQRKVLTEISKKISQKGILDFPKISDNILPYVDTSLSKSEILSLGSYILMNKITTPQQFRIPTDDNLHPTYIDKLYYMKWDKEPTIEKLHKFIYEN